MAVKTELSQGVGARLRAIREEKGIPREQLAIALRMGAENVRHYEAGRTPLTIPMLPVIADLYGMTLAELVSCLFDSGEPGHMVSSNGNESHTNGTANYNYTESRRVLSRGGAPARELVAAGR